MKKIRIHRSPSSDPAKPNKRTKVLVCCYRCEHEWDGDKRGADEDCFVCGAQTGSEDHLITEGESS